VQAPKTKVTAGQVTCAGVDVNAEQVRRGWVWVTNRDKESRLYILQEEAHAARRGLWAP
jgi:endonuclease YncB( thermonuclease family)